MELKNTISELKISLAEFNSRFECTEETISKPENRTIEIIESNELKEKT